MAISNTSNVPIGTVLEGKFRITREIGRGGMAAVYEAENVDIGKRVAVKILAAELITSRIVRERFIREARASASIRSPYICDVYDSGMFEDRPFLVMELLVGESLYDMMTRVRQIDVATTLRVALHTARGLAKAHESNVVHRDLKPENIFLTHDEEGKLLAKVLDFGLAKFYEPTGGDAQSVRLTREGALFGTPAYMSPEQAKGQGEVDHRADLWALGCIVYECLTGQTVWNVEQGVAMILAQIANAPIPRPSKLRPDLPPSFERWFDRALHRDVDKRFQTAKEFSDALVEALSGKEASNNDSESGRSELGTPSESRLRRDRRVSVGEPDNENTDVELASPTSGRAAVELLTEPEPERTGSLRGLSILMVFAALTLGGYATWLYVLHPPGKPADANPKLVTRPTASGSEARRPPNSADVKRGAKPEVLSDAETEPYAKKIAEAQELLKTEPAKAMEVFRAALKDGSMPAARSLLSHAAVAVEEAGDCRVTGVSRPRPFQVEVPVSRPTLAVTSKGIVVSWVDNHFDPKRRQAFTVLLDSAMRRISAPIAVTPEAQNVRAHELVPVGDRLALVYFEDSARDSGVYARLLDAEGKILTSLRKLNTGRKGDYHPVLTPIPGAGFVAIWEEEFETNSTDLVARMLGPDLEPLSAPVRLTALEPPSGNVFQPRTARAAVHRGRLQIAFAKDMGSQRVQVMLQTVALDDPALTTGLPAKAARETAGTVIGKMRPVGVPTGRNPEPSVACTDQGCFVAWDDEKAALTAFVDHERGPLWHRQFGNKGARPALGRNERGAAVAWFEGARLKLAPLTRDGVGKASVVSRVSGLQPYPDVMPGKKAGEWYLAFRDYESGHLEVFALRAECP